MDAQYAPLTERVLTAIAKISPAPVRFLVNTHSHPDHTGGNANMARHGVLLLSREETREEMRIPLPAIAAALASRNDPAWLPGVTYGAGSVIKIHLNNEIIDLICAKKKASRRVIITNPLTEEISTQGTTALRYLARGQESR